MSNRLTLLFPLMIACSGHGSAGYPPHADCDLPPARGVEIYEGGHCPLASCGTNTSVTNGFPFNGLSAAGCKNADGVALIPGSFSRGVSRCTQGGELAVSPYGHDGSELRVKEGDTIVCRGAELAGASFQVWTPRGKVTVVINHVVKVLLDGQDAEKTMSPPAERYVYLFTSLDDPTASLCTTRLSPNAYGASGAIRGELAKDTNSDVAHPHAKEIERGEYAVIIPGTVFKSDGTPIDVAKAEKGWFTEKGWFNIACVGDALGKTEMTGIVDADATDAARDEQRRTALLMFSARYVPEKGAATTPGIPIAWSGWGKQSKNMSDASIIEARWNKKGAECLQHSRLWMSNRVVPWLDLDNANTDAPAVEKDFVKQFGLPDCPADSAAPTTYVVDHVSH